MTNIDINLLSGDSRILYASSIDISLSKGPSINEREFCFGLKKTFHNRIDYLLPKPQNVVKEADNYNITFSKKCSNRNPYEYLLHQIDFSMQLRKMTTLTKYDLLITRLNLLPLGFWVGVKNLDIPIAIKHLAANFTIPSLNCNFIGRYIAKSIVAMHLSIVKKIVAKSVAFDAPTKEFIQGIVHTFNINQESIAHIENATNTDRFKPLDMHSARYKFGLHHFDSIVGYSGGMPWERGGEEMINVAPSILQKHPNTGFVIVGGGFKLELLKEKIRRAGLSKYFTCTGLVPYEDVPSYINCFDIGIAFDRPDLFSVVGNSNQKVRQYIACGKPVIVTPGGNSFVPENDLGSIVDTSQSRDIVREINKWLLLGQREQEAHSQKAADYARKYLSIEGAIMQRIVYWHNQLNAQS